MRKTLAGLAGMAAFALAGCAVLSAPAPLFTAADQDPGFALAEGLWAHLEDSCEVDPATSAPERKDCVDWAKITRAPDGAWRVEFLGEDDGPMRLVVISVTKAEGEGAAPLYVAEATGGKEPGANYGLIVPRDDKALPIHRIAFNAISCSALLSEGEPADIAFERKDGRVVNCVAKTKAAVRDAARRAVFDALADLGDEELVWVRAAP